MLPASTSFGINYFSFSMNPTFKAPDYLHIIPYKKEKIRRGDMIVFRPPGEDRKLVHRVVAVSPTGIRTRGDNRDMDPGVLKPGDILGRVVYVQRGRKWCKVPGGLHGQISPMNSRGYPGIGALISLLLQPLYDWLARKGPFRRLFKGIFKGRILFLTGRREENFS